MSYKQRSPIIVAEGGTGAQTLTDHGVLVGSGTSAVTPLSVGTNGQVLVASSAADPVFATLASSNSSITYATGAGTLGMTVTQATTSQLGGSTLASNAEAIAGTDTAKIITADDLKAKLGAQTNHGVLVGAGTTAAVTALSVGTTGQVLTGVTGSDPVFSTPLVTGCNFLAYKNTQTDNVTGDGTVYTIICQVEEFDIGSNYDNTTGIFTAPVTGKYCFYGQVNLVGLAANHTTMAVRFDTTSNNWNVSGWGGIVANPFVGAYRATGSVFINLTAGNTVSLVARAAGGSLVVDIYGDGTSGRFTYFGGYLISS